MSNEMREILELLKANEERGKALKPLAETAEKADIEAREKELNEIAEERASLEARKEELEAEKRAAAAIDENPASGEVVENQRGEKKEMTNAEIRNTAEYINAFAESIKKEDNKFAACRALLTENVDGGTVPVPDVVYDIVKNAWEREGIMRRVRKLYAKGNIKVGFEISGSDAVAHTEGGDAVAEETLTLGVVDIVPTSIKKWISISDEVYDMRGEDFLRYVYDELTYRIAKKAVDDLIALIVAAGTASTASAVGLPVHTASTVSVGLVAAAIGKLSDQATNPIIVMNKATWSAVKAAQYDNKFSVDPFEGLEVEYNNSLKAFDVASSGDTYMIVGDFDQGALANFPNREEISITRIQDKELATKDLIGFLGREYVGLGIVGPNAFVRIKK